MNEKLRYRFAGKTIGPRTFTATPYDFWARVTKSDGCWNFSPTNKHGYGRFTAETGKRWQAHRYAWTDVNGPIPDGLFVCHACDNKACCNPAHLWLGTAADNNRDKIEKGREARGENSPYRKNIESFPKGSETYNAKLTEDVVREIRALAATGVGIRTLARQFGVARMTARRVVMKETWKHVP